jgi:uncharacterized ferritin-like protein (DUF455 family)
MMTQELLQQIKEAGQDFEWYPTTRDMLAVIAKDIRARQQRRGESLCFSLLDIGAGNGSAITMLRELTESTGDDYAIEKAKLLIDSLPAEVFPIGSDFHQQTLIDKKADVIFCNPPYSEYADWARKILREANARTVYLIIPRRWIADKEILEILRKRCSYGEEKENGRDMGGEVKILSSFSFESSGLRASRALVDILKITFDNYGTYRGGNLVVDPFDLWFEETFNLKAETSDTEYSADPPENELRELCKGHNLIERLEELYHADLANLHAVYRSLESFDAQLFRELGVSLDQVKGSLRARIAGLKNLYWQELFSNLDAITSRLTSKSREQLLKKLTAHTSVDFSSENAYAVVLWAIKNANSYFDSQLLSLYFDLAYRENIRLYKSNHRLIEDGWRYQKQEMTHFTLDYRLVLERYSCFNSKDYGDYEYPNGLHRDQHTFLNDIGTIAKNLGFDVLTDSRNLHWSPGVMNEFYCADGSLFMDVRAYKKGTVHIRVDQTFMKRLNIEAARLNGWVKSAKEAAEETGIENAADFYEKNFKFTGIRLLGPGIFKEEDSGAWTE